MVIYLSLLLAYVTTKAYSFGDTWNNNNYIDPESMSWETRAYFPGGGRHHPITFANSTHGFVLTGSTGSNFYTNDFWVFEEVNNKWTDLSSTPSAFPGTARSFGYGVASTLDCSNTKAYLGFGLNSYGVPLTDFWEFDMFTNKWKRLAEFPGQGRKHPAMNFVEKVGEIHVGLGDGYGGNYDDWWSYNINSDSWRRLPDFPSSRRHHPFYFVIGYDSYAGLGHSDGFSPYIERDWYRYDSLRNTWNREDDFASYALNSSPQSFPVTTEARVAGTQFSVAGSCNSKKTLGFVLSGDGDDHRIMNSGEFHVFDSETKTWHSLPPHPGISRWAPGSFVMQGSTRAYFFGGYDRQTGIYHYDLWKIDLAPLFDQYDSSTTVYSSMLKANVSAATQSLNSFALLPIMIIISCAIAVVS